MSNVIEISAKLSGTETIDTPTKMKIDWLLEQCRANRQLGVIRGGFGVGKTFCMKRFAMGYPTNVVFATLNPTGRSLTGALRIIVETLKPICEHEPLVRRISDRTFAPLRAYEKIREAFEDIFFVHGRTLLIVDEAQHAQADVLDTFRALFDEGVFGLVIAGNERLFNPRRGRMETADFGALLSRAHHVLDIPASTAADIDAVLDAHRITGQQSRKLLRERAAAGGLRELIAVIGKARAMSGIATVGHKHLKAAAEMTGLSASTWTSRWR